MGRLSLRARVLVIAMALVAVALLVSQTVAVRSLRGFLTDQMDRQLAQAARVMAFRPLDQQPPASASGVGNGAVPGAANGTAGNGGGTAGSTGGGGGGGGPERRPRTPGVLPSRVVAAYIAPDGTTREQVRSPGGEAEHGPALPRLDEGAVARRAGEPFETGAAQGGGRWRVMAVAMVDDEGSVVVAMSLDDIDATVERLRLVCLGIGAGSLAVLAVAGWFALRGGLRPLGRIEETAAAIAAGDLSHRMPVTAPGTEVGRLSASLNGMLAQIEEAFAVRAESEVRMRRFVADAGHELRTPLSSIRGFAELHRMGALREPAEVARTMRRIEDEAVRMGGLIEDLLQLARLDEQRPLERAPVDLRILAADAVLDIKTLAPDRPVALTGLDGGPAPAVVVDGDEARLRQVASNLVSNALRHTRAGTPVRIAVGHQGTCGVFEVRDAGPGLAPEDARRVFERFYRVDSSRTRVGGGGSGLGLAIVAALAAAHGGRAEVLTAEGAGAAFRVLLPAPPGPGPATCAKAVPGAASPVAGEAAGGAAGGAVTGPSEA